MLRALKFKLDISSLEKIYFSFIRPIFEYACIVWDSAPRHCYYFYKMENCKYLLLGLSLAQTITHLIIYYIMILVVLQKRNAALNIIL